MDTTNASGALDTGSIPVGTTRIYNYIIELQQDILFMFFKCANICANIFTALPCKMPEKTLKN